MSAITTSDRLFAGSGCSSDDAAHFDLDAEIPLVTIAFAFPCLLGLSRDQGCWSYLGYYCWWSEYANSCTSISTSGI